MDKVDPLAALYASIAPRPGDQPDVVRDLSAEHRERCLAERAKANTSARQPKPRRLPRVGDADWAALDNAEKLHALTSEALSVQRELLKLNVDPDDPKRNAMLKDLTGSIINAQIKVEETTLKQKRSDDVMEMISKRIAEAKVRLGREPGMLPPESD